MASRNLRMRRGSERPRSVISTPEGSPRYAIGRSALSTTAQSAPGFGLRRAERRPIRLNGRVRAKAVSPQDSPRSFGGGEIQAAMRAAGRTRRAARPVAAPNLSYFFDPEAGLAVTTHFVDGSAAIVFTFGALGFFASRLPRLLSVAMSASVRKPVTQLARPG